MTDLLTDLVLALRSRDKKKIETAYNMLSRVGMDRMTANILLKDREVQEEIKNVLKERKIIC